VTPWVLQVVGAVRLRYRVERPRIRLWEASFCIFWLQMDWHSKVEDVALIAIIAGVFAIRPCGWRSCAVYNRIGESALYADEGLLESSPPHIYGRFGKSYHPP
jgi:hypothetical protein